MHDAANALIPAHTAPYVTGYMNSFRGGSTVIALALLF